MKKITKPAEREEAIYFSDFSGKCFGEHFPPVELKLSFGYGSKHDGAEISLHLDDEDVAPVIELLKSKISEDFKNIRKKQLESYEKQYDDSMQMRDWDFCDRLSETMWFWREFLDLKDDENN